MTEQTQQEQQQQHQQELLKKYKERGFQQLSLAEYESLKARKSKRALFRLPLHMKLILATPFLVIFCLGIYFIPYILYLVTTSPDANPKDYKTEVSVDELIGKTSSKDKDSSDDFWDSK
jgi:hypothetical protein